MKDLRVLLVASDELELENAEKALRHAGIQKISLFSSVIDAVVFLRSAVKTNNGFPSVALVQMIMAPFSGYSFLEACRNCSDEQIKELPVYFMVPNPQVSLQLEARAVGAEGLLDLPLCPEDCTDIMETCLAASPLPRHRVYGELVP